MQEVQAPLQPAVGTEGTDIPIHQDLHRAHRIICVRDEPSTSRVRRTQSNTHFRFDAAITIGEWPSAHLHRQRLSKKVYHFDGRLCRALAAPSRSNRPYHFDALAAWPSAIGQAVMDCLLSMSPLEARQTYSLQKAA